jgi:hypothetical protein
MSLSNVIKHYTFSAITALSPSNPSQSKGNLGTAVEGVKTFFADLGVNESVRRQLLGIEQMINSELVNLSPYAARQNIGIRPQRLIERTDCSIYDAKPTKEALQRAGALVFVKYFVDDFGVIRDPVVEFVGFGKDMESAWKSAQKMPRVTVAGKGRFKPEKSYMLWYQFKVGKIESGKIEFPFYLPVVNSK